MKGDSRMDLLHSSTSTSTGIVCTAVSNERLLELATETDAIDVGRVDGDYLPRRLAGQVQELLISVRSGTLDEGLVADDPSHAPTAMVQLLRQQLRQAGRSLLAGTRTRPGSHSDEVVLVLGFPRGVVHRAEVCCDLD